MITHILLLALFSLLYIFCSLGFMSLVSFGKLSIKRYLKDTAYENRVENFWLANTEAISLAYFLLKLAGLVYLLYLVQQHQMLHIALPLIAALEIIAFSLSYHSTFTPYLALNGVLILRTILFPFFLFVRLFYRLVSFLITTIVPQPEEDVEIMEDESEIEEMIMEDGNLLDKEERKMIMSIIQFNDTVVKEVMTPRIDLACIEISAPTRELMEVIAKEGHSRIPVYEKKVDNIVGTVYAKDVLNALKENDCDNIQIKDMLRSPYFVPESKNISHLLKEFMRNEVHIAVVVDEYGGTAGVVTIEDLLEEIVGEIRDEYDTDEDKPYKILEDHSIIIDAKADIEILEELFSIKIADDDFESVGGLIFNLIGRVPDTGETVTYESLSLKILDADERKINQVRIKRIV